MGIEMVIAILLLDINLSGNVNVYMKCLEDAHGCSLVSLLTFLQRKLREEKTKMFGESQH